MEAPPGVSSIDWLLLESRVEKNILVAPIYAKYIVLSQRPPRRYVAEEASLANAEAISNDVLLVIETILFETPPIVMISPVTKSELNVVPVPVTVVVEVDTVPDKFVETGITF